MLMRNDKASNQRCPKEMSCKNKSGEIRHFVAYPISCVMSCCHLLIVVVLLLLYNGYSRVVLSIETTATTWPLHFGYHSLQHRHHFAFVHEIHHLQTLKHSRLFN